MRTPISSRAAHECSSRRRAFRLTSVALLLALVVSIFGRQTPALAQEPVVDPAKQETHNDAKEQPSEYEVITLPAAAVNATVSSASIAGIAPSGGTYVDESEPNNDSLTATPLGGLSVKANGLVYPAADVDVYSFAAQAGDRVYAATQTQFDASASGNSVLELLDTDGTTLIESDDNDGTFNASSSSIAGTTIPANGTYFLRVRHLLATGTIRPYDLYFTLQRGAPAAEVEPNEVTGSATPLPASGWASGAVSAVSPGEMDFFSLALQAGDTVFLSLDMNPERDANIWNGRLGFGMFGNPPATQVLIANDANAGAGDPNSEAFFFTVLDGGTYYVVVDSLAAAGLGVNATYHLSAAVFNTVPNPGVCTTYTNNTPAAIPTGPGIVSSTISVPGNPRIADIDVSINITHTFMQDLDAHLSSPAGNDNGLFTDIGPGTTGGPQTLMDLRFDDDAGLPPGSASVLAVTAPMVLQPELAYRLGWFNGEDAGGDWTLTLRDDATADGGTLNSWSLTICEPVPPTGPKKTLYSFDFESGDGGFTHSGAQDEWELGTPAVAAAGSTPAFQTCNSGVNCWKTDLDNTYNASSSQDLLSPSLDLTGRSGPVRLQWAMRYHMESANFDHLYVEAREVGNSSNAVRVFEWLDATMNNTVGNPSATIGESAGWGVYSGDISALAGLNVEVLFHLDSDTTVQLQGVAIDDVQILVPPRADLALVKSVSPAVVTPGDPITYTLTFTNTGPDLASSVVLTDVLPLDLTNLSVASSGAVITDTGAIPAFVWQVEDLSPGQTGMITLAGTLNPSHTAAGLFTNTATIAAAEEDLTPADNTATTPVTILVSDITVLGNGLPIANGDTSPSPADHTDFGALALGQPLTRTFTVSNTGSATLTVTGLTMGGAAAANFSLSGLTAPASVAPGGAVIFAVKFVPAATGVLTATVVIASDDGDANPYTFDVQGTGTNAAPIANAGVDQNVVVGTQVTLNGSASSDADGHLPLTYDWVQSSGTPVSLSSAGAAQPTFTAPAAPATLTFALTVRDSFGLASAADSVTVTVGAVPQISVHLPIVKR